ncbi:ricin-type beta-trefoil lectin domain protein [Streptomyces kanasensis]|uniref:ricin-type beta-trefoil lectin domain protein n=1 Tax=Streptomyces kanasensis TaxID=936756 RepID=UPI0037FF2D86
MTDASHRGGANQYWSAYTDGTLRTLGECLDAADWGTANSTEVQLCACHGGAHQRWTTLTVG